LADILSRWRKIPTVSPEQRTLMLIGTIQARSDSQSDLQGDTLEELSDSTSDDETEHDDQDEFALLRAAIQGTRQPLDFRDLWAQLDRCTKDSSGRFIISSQTLRIQLITLAHARSYGHRGAHATFHDLNKLFFWKESKKQVQTFVSKCFVLLSMQRFPSSISISFAVACR